MWYIDIAFIDKCVPLSRQTLSCPPFWLKSDRCMRLFLASFASWRFNVFSQFEPKKNHVFARARADFA